jgi:tetratricopeptide (TPR) repeat protein
MSTAPFDLAKAHRWFAIELNNRAWELVEAPARTGEETAEMLSAAHAARYHWRQVGTPINFARADSLVATAYLAAARPEVALGYAQSCLQQCEQPGNDATRFDRACAYGAVACALGGLGKREQAKGYYAQALEQVAHFESAEDRSVFENLYSAP